MGNKLTQQQQALSQSLQQQYFFQSNQFLVHKGTQRPCTLHRIQTFSKEQSGAAERNIAVYQQLRCNSISKLNEHYELDNSGYCSDQQKFYLVFDGHNSPNIKEQYFSRRYLGQGFSHQEIEAILSCMLCGLRHYNEAFNRKESHISLQSVCINRHEGNRLWLKDPWLMQKNYDLNQAPINFFATYPSPQKIQASNQANYDYDEFKSDLFSVGIFGLQFLNMNFRDDLYVHKKFVDRQKVGDSLNGIQNGRLRGGLGMLLSEDPNQRSKIYQYWDVQCSKVYRINGVTLPNTSPSTFAQSQSQIPIPIPMTPRSRPQLIQYTSTPSPVSQYNLQQSQVTKPFFYNIAPKVIQNMMPSNINNSQSHSHSNRSPSPNPSINISNAHVNASNNIHWKPNVSNVTKSSQIFVNPPSQTQINNVSKLQKQFSKPIQMKNNLYNTASNRNIANFKKSPENKVYFREPSPQPQQPQQQRTPQLSIPKQATTPNISFKPQPQQQMQIPAQPQAQYTQNYSNITMTQSITHPQNSKNPLVKSFETPKFNYQSPTFNPNDIKNSISSSYNPIHSSTQNNPSLLNSFNLFGNTQQSSQPQNTYYPGSSSPPMVKTGNSPIMTKSIISSVQTVPNYGAGNNYMAMPKNSTEENTQVYSNGQSLRETKFASEGDRNTFSSGSIPLGVPTQVPNQIKQQPVKPQEPVKVMTPPLPIPIPAITNTNSIYNVANTTTATPSIPTQTYSQPVGEIKPPKLEPTHLISSPEPENIPKSPSTVQVTPPPAHRNPNKYNSTIVEVNEETPNQSQESENQNNAEIEFIVEEYETGSKYQGFKKNGLRHGRGKFFYQDGGYYDGQWKRNQMHGWGKLYYQGGQLAYEGNWAHDQFHGYGKVYNDNPVVLEGGFDYTNFDLLDDYWQFYEGMLANDTKQGRGRIQLTNKEVFEGDFHADRIQGFGKFLRRDGNIVQGIWRDSRLIKILSSNDIYR